MFSFFDFGSHDITESVLLIFFFFSTEVAEISNSTYLELHNPYGYIFYVFFFFCFLCEWGKFDKKKKFTRNIDTNRLDYFNNRRGRVESRRSAESYEYYVTTRNTAKYTALDFFTGLFCPR